MARRNLNDYWQEGFDAARKLLGPSTPLHLTNEQARSMLDALPGSARMQMGLADFWLGYSETEGRQRRKLNPPAHPFIHKDGNKRLGEKAAIEAWGEQWQILNAIAQAQRDAKVLKQKTHVTLNVLTAHLTVLVGTQGQAHAIIDSLSSLDLKAFAGALGSPHTLTMKRMTLPQMLAMPWRNPRRRRVWAERSLRLDPLGD